jgi:aminoglycoside 2''-phosphotransferase
MTSEMAALIVAEQFPQFGGASISFLGAGDDNDAFEVNSQWVFRFPKHAVQNERAAMEARVVRHIADRLPLAVPRFEFAGAASELHPFRFDVYRKIPGTSWKDIEPAILSDAVARQLGEFLSALHAIPIAEVEPLGIGSDREYTMAARLSELKNPPAVRVLLPEYDGPSLLIHNDLLAEHVLIDPLTSCVTGIIDFGDMACGDPAVDFAGIAAFAGEAFLRKVVTHYTRRFDDRMLARAIFIGQCINAVL